MIPASAKPVAPCGIDCFNCEIYTDNVTEKTQAFLAPKLGLAPADVACKGCRDQPGCLLHKDCETLACVATKKVDYCFECDEFPCIKLQPLAEGADKYPHNLKVFNLSRMKLLGVELWKEEASDIRARYYRGKFVIGAGPKLPS